MTRKIGVFVVDHHCLIAEGLKQALESQENMEFVGSASTAKSALLTIESAIPDVILMDINLPDRNGLDLMPDILKLYPSVKILGLSTTTLRKVVVTMLENGAKGYLTKNCEVDEILQAIYHVNRGNIFLCREASEHLQKHLNQAEAENLTNRESEVLKLVVDGLTATEISEILFVSRLTIESHRRNLLVKLKVKNIASLVKTAIEKDLV